MRGNLSHVGDAPREDDDFICLNGQTKGKKIEIDNFI